MINDQTIANFCSDTSREIDNLTEELRFYNVCSQSHSIEKRTTNSEQSDRDSDVVDSSPFYTHINHRLENSGSDLNAKLDPRDRSLSNLDAFIDSIDGAADPGDDFPSVACMLQSVDLRGKFFEPPNTGAILSSCFRRYLFAQLTSIDVGWKHRNQY